MSELNDAAQRLEKAVEHLERALGKAARVKNDQQVLSQTAVQVATRLDSAIGRLDRILED